MTCLMMKANLNYMSDCWWSYFSSQLYKTYIVRSWIYSNLGFFPWTLVIAGKHLYQKQSLAPAFTDLGPKQKRSGRFQSELCWNMEAAVYDGKLHYGCFVCLSNLKCYPWLETEASAAGCLVSLYTQLTETLHHKFRGGCEASTSVFSL